MTNMQNIPLILAVILAIIAAAASRDSVELKDAEIVNPYVCQPGDSFKLDCNHCQCGSTPGEVGACTLMACWIPEGKCLPDSYFQVNGQLCSCPSSELKIDSDCFRFPEPECK